MPNTNLPDFKQGDDKEYNLFFKRANGDAIDITGWTIWLTFKENINDLDSQAVIQKKITQHINPTQGESSVHLSGSDTTTLLGRYFYDVQVKLINGYIKTVATGFVVVVQEVTDTKL